MQLILLNTAQVVFSLKIYSKEITQWCFIFSMAQKHYYHTAVTSTTLQQ